MYWATRLGNDSPWQTIARIARISPAAWPAATTRQRAPKTRNAPAVPRGPIDLAAVAMAKASLEPGLGKFTISPSHSSLHSVVSLHTQRLCTLLLLAAAYKSSRLAAFPEVRLYWPFLHATLPCTIAANLNICKRSLHRSLYCSLCTSAQSLHCCKRLVLLRNLACIWLHLAFALVALHPALAIHRTRCRGTATTTVVQLPLDLRTLMRADMGRRRHLHNTYAQRLVRQPMIMHQRPARDFRRSARKLVNHSCSRACIAAAI